MADPVAIANEFVKFYYATFDAGRANLGSVYVSAVPCMIDGGCRSVMLIAPAYTARI